MKIIGRIASLELRSLFYSPIAWLVLIAFTIPPGIAFADHLGGLQRNQYLGQPLFRLTRSLFASPSGLFNQVQEYLYLYIPLLTMGLISRELSSGSIKLLYSSPIETRHIVLGKFLAMMGYGLVLVGILGSFSLAASMLIDQMDVKFVLSGILGLYLLICAYAAIGLFMSCLTSYQVVAAVSTLMVLAALRYVGSIGQEFDFVRDLTYFLSISGRSAGFISGLISSRDVAYFFIVISLFLSLSILALRSVRESSRPTIYGIRYASVIVVALLLGYATSRPALRAYYDMSANKDNTLTENSQAILARMIAPLRISTYVNLLDQRIHYALPQNRNADLRRFEAYLRFKPEMDMRYTYYFDTSQNRYLYTSNPQLNTEQLAQRVAESRGLDLRRFLRPGEIRRQIDLSPEENRLVRKIEYMGRQSFLRMFDDISVYPQEAEITAALKRLVLATPPKVAFVSGHGERRLDRAADSDYQLVTRKLTYRYSLINQGFDVTTLELNGQPIPRDVTVLVIADPKEALTEAAPSILEYIESGGNMLVAGDPGDQAILNSLLGDLGVEFMAEPLVQQHKDFPSSFVLGELAESAIKHSSNDDGLFDERVAVEMAVPGYGSSLFKVRNISLPGALGIRYREQAGFSAQPVILAQTQEQHVLSVPVALGLTRRRSGKEQRIMVVGDADFMSNQEMSRRNVAASNLSFTLETFKWLSNGEFPVNTSRPPSRDNTVLVSRDSIFRWRMFFVAILPLLIAVSGATLLIRRRRA